MSFFGDTINHFIASWGYIAVFSIVALEGFGLFFLPGETTLISAALVAGATGKLSILLVLLAAFCGAVIGDNFSFWMGYRFGFPLLRRYGHYIGLRERRLKFVQYLFLRYGRPIVFVGRFVILLRAWEAFMAGADAMPWRRFAPINASAILIWASIWGGGAWWIGEASTSLLRWVGMAIFLTVAVALIAGGLYFHHHENEFEARADEALPGPLRAHLPSDLRLTSGRGFHFER
ncbi:MAG TPA: DedA family protein [Steroidobacteraceae bacterium]